MIEMQELFEKLTEQMTDEMVASADALSDIAVELVKYRVNHNLDQRQMAKLLNVSQPMISKYESGTYNFTVKTLFEIAYKLGININLEVNGEECSKPVIENSVVFSKTSKDRRFYDTLFYNQEKKPTSTEFVTTASGVA